MLSTSQTDGGCDFCHHVSSSAGAGVPGPWTQPGLGGVGLSARKAAADEPVIDGLLKQLTGPSNDL